MKRLLAFIAIIAIINSTLSVASSSGLNHHSSSSLSTDTVSAQPPSSAPILRGWAGVTLGESDSKTGNPSSAIFAGQAASDMELEFANLTAHRLNTERVIFADPNTSPASVVNSTLTPSFFFTPTRLNRTVAIAQHFGIWLILNTHNFCDWVNASYSCAEPEMKYTITNAEPKWLSFWRYNVTQPYMSVYSQLIYEPINEPLVVGTINCTPTCPNANNVTLPYGMGGNPIYIQQPYQDFINMERSSVGDTSHYLVVENAEWDGDFPIVADSANRTLLNRHWYYMYGSQSPQYQNFDYNGPGGTYKIHLVSCTWSISCAQSYADNASSFELAAEARFHRVIINTEIGADYGGKSPPDALAIGSCSYSTSSLSFVQKIVDDLSSTDQIGFTLWTNGDWSGLGVYGCINNWGSQVTIPPVGGSSTPPYTLTLQGYDYDGAQEETLTLNNRLLTKLPATDSPQNAGIYANFTVNNLPVANGTNTLVFTHANFDCGVTDTTRNVQITKGAGTIIFSDPTARPLSCTQSITYTFTV